MNWLNLSFSFIKASFMYSVLCPSNVQEKLRNNPKLSLSFLIIDYYYFAVVAEGTMCSLITLYALKIGL